MVQNEIQPQVIDSQEIEKANKIIVNPEEYKEKLKLLPEVKALTNEINIQDVNTIATFGQKSAEEISKISDKILNIAKVPTNKDAAQMITQLSKIMDKFDIREIEKIQDEPAKRSFLQKLKQKIADEFEALVAKYDNMSKEVDKIAQLLRTYENQTKQDNVTLTEMCQANHSYFEQLERYVVAAEIGLEEIASYREQVANRTDISEDNKNVQLQQLDMMSQMLRQRQYDLLQAEIVARMTVPMLQNMQLTNVNLIREINTAFIIGLPIFKQNLAQAIMLKRQAITANSMEQFKGTINKQLEQNATYAAAQGTVVAQNVTKGTFDMETLRKVYSTIKNGTENTQRVMREQEEQNKENAKDLERLKSDIQSGSLNVLQAPNPTN